MAKENNNKAHYLVTYASELRRLNDFEIDIPLDPIEDVIKDPLAYAQGFIEREIEEKLPNILEAFELGRDLAKKNMEGE
tara:strand:- start:818 stop:1054 length:237 start_codon:yes stop_codon:yes gene_type:complete